MFPQISPTLAIHISEEGIRPTTIKSLDEIKDCSLKYIRPYRFGCGDLHPKPKCITLEREPHEVYELSERSYGNLKIEYQRKGRNNPEVNSLIASIDSALS